MAVFTALLAASTGTAGEARRPTACAMLEAGLKGTVIGARTKPARGNTKLSCTHTDGKPLTESTWQASLSFYPYPPAKPSVSGARSAWNAIYAAVRKKGEEPERLRGFGADDAFGYESEKPTALPGPLRTSAITWRKGTYLGELDLTAPLSSNLGDLDDGVIILKDALRLLPRR